MWRSWKRALCVCVCVLVLSVSNHSDPRVAWLGQGAGIQWRGCPTVAASFRCQSKSGMEREVDIACKQVSVVVKADVGVCLCVCVCACLGTSVILNHWFNIFLSYPNSIRHALMQTHTMFILLVTITEPVGGPVGRVWTFCLSVSAFTGPLLLGCSSSSYNLNEWICF